MNSDGVEQLGKTRWRVRVQRRELRTGRIRNRKRIVTGSKGDAVRVRDELRAKLASSALLGARPRLAEYAPAWLAVRRLRQSTRDRYTRDLVHVLAVLGDVYVDALGPLDVKAYLAKRLTVAAPNTVRNELRMLRALARDSVADRVATTYWCDRVAAPEVVGYTDDEPNLLTPAEAARVIAEVPGRWRGLVLLCVTTGLRIGEATGARWEDLELVQVGELVVGKLRVHRNNARGREDRVKTASSVRVVIVLPEVLAELGLRREHGLLFAARSGGLHRGSPLRYALDRACARAGVRRVTTHGLRRTFNDAARTRAEREVLHAVTGHATDEMTEHYSRVSLAEKSALAVAVAAAIGVLRVSAARTASADK